MAKTRNFADVIRAMMAKDPELAKAIELEQLGTLAEQIVYQWDNHDRFRPNEGEPPQVTLARGTLALLARTDGPVVEALQSLLAVTCYVDNGQCSLCHGHWPDGHREHCQGEKARQALSGIPPDPRRTPSPREVTSLRMERS